jgi:hypothetical protein
MSSQRLSSLVRLFDCCLVMPEHVVLLLSVFSFVISFVPNVELFELDISRQLFERILKLWSHVQKHSLCSLAVQTLLFVPASLQKRNVVSILDKVMDNVKQ